MSEEFFQANFTGVKMQLGGRSKPGLAQAQTWASATPGLTGPARGGRIHTPENPALQAFRGSWLAAHARADNDAEVVERNPKGEIGQITAREAWALLKREHESYLIDVRTKAEWAYVGIPDLSSLGKGVFLCEWQSFPDMTVNMTFCEDLERHFLGRSDAVLLFLCRSGGRSGAAANAMAARGYRRCFNVCDGFEGDLSTGRRRGLINGWKVSGLPWMQT